MQIQRYVFGTALVVMMLEHCADVKVTPFAPGTYLTWHMATQAAVELPLTLTGTLVLPLGVEAVVELAARPTMLAARKKKKEKCILGI